MYKKYNSQNEVIGIVCSLCEKNYAKKSSTRPLMDHLTKEHSNILSTTNQLQKPYNENDNKSHRMVFNYFQLSYLFLKS